MGKIVIIDDSINPKYLSNKNYNYYIVENHRVLPKRISEVNTSLVTHSTLCAMVLEKYSNNFELTNIALMPDKLGFFNVKDLIIALQFCQHIKPDIINMSIGTTSPSDFAIISDVIDKLCHLNICIVAALSNDDIITYPASQKNVFGVVCNHTINNKTKRIVRFDNNILGVDFFVKCPVSLCFEGEIIKQYLPSNSFGAPIITAEANNMIDKNPQLNGYSLLNSISFRTKMPSSIYIKKVVESTKKTEDKPTICLLLSDESQNHIPLKIVDYLQNNRRLNIVAFSLSDRVSDPRFIKMVKLPNNNFSKAIEDMQKLVKADLFLFVFAYREVPSFVSIYSAFDLTIELEKTSAKLTINCVKYLVNKKVKYCGHIKKLCRKIIKCFQQYGQ